MIDQMDVLVAEKNQVTIPTRAWYGDEELSLEFPARWDLTLLGPKDAPPATGAQIEEAFANPIGTARIAELARGKASAAIIVDDLSRPTPAAKLIPYVLRELAEAGVPRSEIRFVVGGGSHRPLTEEEIVKKVGTDVAAEYEVTSHDFMAGDLRGLGALEDGTPLYFNRVVVDSEFKMTIGGIYPHGAVGFGGGSKLILPGVAGFATMYHFHTFYPGRGQAVIERVGDVPDHRDASEAAARVLGLDVVVNVVLTSRREIARVFVGDFIQAHRAGAHFALDTYGTEIPADLRKEADVMVVNAYPLDSDPIQTGKALWAQKYFENVYGVVVNPATDGICYHGLFDRINWGRFKREMDTRERLADPEPIIETQDQLLVWSQHYQANDFPRKMPTGVLFRKWDDLLSQLAQKVPDNARVAVFPCSGIQVLAEA